mgnify:FL=1
MGTESKKMSRAARLVVGLLALLVAILFWLVLRQPGQQLNSSLGDNISVRQDQGQVQWRLPGGDWQTITTVTELTGQKGADGKDGVAGAQGLTGATGTDGVDGQNGKDGAHGANGINGADGAGGREIELQKDLYYIQWRYVGEAGWRNLIAYSDLRGDKGDKGDTGPQGPSGGTTPNTLSVGTVNRTVCNPTASVTGDAPDQTLNLGIPGLPAGGTTGQVLQKDSNSDCDAVWADSGKEELIASWVQGDTNRTSIISVDESTWTFVSPSHGLANNTRLYAINDLTKPLVDPSKYLPGGFIMNGDIGMYVVNVTQDTFQLSATNGGEIGRAHV